MVLEEEGTVVGVDDDGGRAEVGVPMPSSVCGGGGGGLP